MHEVQESKIVPYTKKEMFELVADVDRYQEFLPWCKDSRVVRREYNTVVAEIGAKLGLASISFTTSNEFYHYERISIELLEGPFETVEGSWRFSSESERSCKIEFNLRLRFAHERLATLFDPLFQEATDTVIKAFKDRAQTIYGSP
jgi:ribosome-associated toxin RatA of RatAB toxin-antitoxin module